MKKKNRKPPKISVAINFFLGQQIFWTYSHLCRLKVDLPTNMKKRKRMIALSIVLIFLLIYFCQFQSSKTSFDRDKQKILFMVTGSMGCQISKDWIKNKK